MSARADTWMPFYIGDYLADTMHLNGAQHGAYILLIIHYWRSGPPRDDDTELAAIARTPPKVWAKEVGPVVRRFFTAADGFLRHKRCEKEIANASAITSAKARAGKKGAETRWQKDGTAMAEPSVRHRQTDAPSPSPSSKEERKKDSSLRSLVGLEEFDQFWAIYPRKIGKGSAREAFAKARRKVTCEIILAALGAYQFADDPTKQPHATTWLNQERWDFEPDTRPLTVATERRRSSANGAERLIDDFGIDILTPLNQQFPTQEVIDADP